MTCECPWGNFESHNRRTIMINSGSNFQQVWTLSPDLTIQKVIKPGFENFNSYTLAFMCFQYIGKDENLKNKDNKVMIAFDDTSCEYGPNHLMFQRMAQQFQPGQASITQFSGELVAKEIEQIKSQNYLTFIFSPVQQNELKMQIKAQKPELIADCQRIFAIKLGQQVQRNQQTFFQTNGPNRLLCPQNNPAVAIIATASTKPATGSVIKSPSVQSLLYDCIKLGGNNFYIFENSQRTFQKLKQQLNPVQQQSIDLTANKGGQVYMFIPEKLQTSITLLSYFKFETLYNLKTANPSNLKSQALIQDFITQNGGSLQQLPQFYAEADQVSITNGQSNLEQIIGDHGEIMSQQFFKEFKGVVVTFTFDSLKLPAFMSFGNTTNLRSACQCLFPYIHCKNDKILKLSYNVEYTTQSPGVIFGPEFLNILSTVKQLVFDEMKQIKQKIQDKGASVTNIQNTDKQVDMSLLAQPCQSVHNAYSNFTLQNESAEVRRKIESTIGYNNQICNIGKGAVDFEKDYGYGYLAEKKGENEIETTIFQPVIAQPENKEVKVVQ